MNNRQYLVIFSMRNKGNGVFSYQKIQDYVIADSDTEAKMITKSKYGDILIHSAESIKDASSGNSDNSDTIWIKLGIVGAILYGLWILLSNIINFGLISKYDFDLYLSNITHFNSSFKKKATSIDTTIDLTYPEEFVGKKYQISKNKIVFYNGYKDSKIERSTAISLYDNETKIYGYIKHAKNIDPLKTIDSEIVSKINTSIDSRYKKDIESKVKLYQAKTKAEIEDYENKNYKKISQLSDKKITYFYSNDNTELVENIESEYYDDEVYEKEFSKLGNEYYKSKK